MEQFIEKLGIDWRLLLSQVVNFIVLIFVLRAFAYKPILKILHDRKKKIEEGLVKAREADERLGHIEVMKKEKLKEAEREALFMLRETEHKSKQMEAKMLDEARKKEAEVMAGAERAALAKQEEARLVMEQEAAKLVKAAIMKTVEMKPEEIDEKLIERAVEAARKS